MKRIRAFALFTAIFSMTGLAQQSKTTLGGYGELHYNRNTYGLPLRDMTGQFDFHRFVLFVGHDFSDWISFKSELEVEHTQVKTNNDAEVSIEQAYIDLNYTSYFGIRAGILLIPVGIINEFHEPSIFHGVERPNVDRNIIPTTWREAGGGIYGKIGDGISYRAYILAGSIPSGLSSSGIRGTRQVAYNSKTSDWAFTGRLEFVPALGIKTGASVYSSGLESSHLYGDQIKGARLSMFETDVQYRIGEFEFRGLGVYSKISETEKLNTLFAGKNIADSQFGFYAECAYNFLPLILPDSDQQLFIFGRYEKYDTQNSVSGSVIASASNNKNENTLGFTYKPDPNVSIKADYQWMGNATGAKFTQQLNLGIGYFFY